MFKKGFIPVRVQVQIAIVFPTRPSADGPKLIG